MPKDRSGSRSPDGDELTACVRPLGPPASAFDPNRFLRQRLAQFRKAMPLIPVLGVLVVAAAAKTGYGGWAAGAVAASVPAYFGGVATATLTRFLGIWIARTRRYEGAAISSTGRSLAGLGPAGLASAGRGCVTTSNLQKRAAGIRCANDAQPHCACRKRAA